MPVHATRTFHLSWVLPFRELNFRLSFLSCFSLLQRWYAQGVLEVVIFLPSSQLNEKLWWPCWLLSGFQYNMPSPFLQILTCPKCRVWLSGAWRLMEDLTGIVFSSFLWSKTCGDLLRSGWGIFLQMTGEVSPCPALPQWLVIMMIIMIIVVVRRRLLRGGLSSGNEGHSLSHIFKYALTLLIAASVCISGV